MRNSLIPKKSPGLIWGLEIAVAFALPFLLYILTLAPTIYNLDSAELTTAAATLGLTRSTGYPLYILIGNLWSKDSCWGCGLSFEPFLCLEWRVDNHHGYANPPAVGGTFSLASFGALGLLATSRNFWGLSLIAEVYTLQTTLIAVLIYCLTKWQKSPHLEICLPWVCLLAWECATTLPRFSSYQLHFCLFSLLRFLPGES